MSRPWSNAQAAESVLMTQRVVRLTTGSVGVAEAVGKIVSAINWRELVETRPALAVLCGVLAVGLGLVVEWRFAPFVADSSFSFFLTHLTGLQLPTVVMLAIGAVVGFWVPFRRRASAGAPSARASA